MDSVDGQNSGLRGKPPSGGGWGQRTVRGNAESVNQDERLLLAENLWVGRCDTWGCFLKSSRKQAQAA